MAEAGELEKMSTFYIGDIRVDRIVEFEMPLLAPKTLFPTSTTEHIERHISWLSGHLYDPQSDQLVLAMHSFLIHSRAGLILIDTCSGNDRERPQKERYHRKKWQYLERFEQIGVRPEEIDYVLCTHLHVDHVGWNTRLVDGRWVPTFPNALYLFGLKEWEFWKEEYFRSDFTADPYYKDCILPILDAGRAAFIGDQFSFDENVWVEPSPGHTPGHICVRLRSRGQDAVFSGDLMHHALQCAEPQLSSCFCVDPKKSFETRLGFLEANADNGTKILPAHFPTPSVGTIVSSGNTFRFKFEVE